MAIFFIMEAGVDRSPSFVVLVLVLTGLAKYPRMINSLYRLTKPSTSIQELDIIHRELVLEFQCVYFDTIGSLHQTTWPLIYTFPFETYNKTILGSIHGTNKVANGISERNCTMLDGSAG